MQQLIQFVQFRVLFPIVITVEKLLTRLSPVGNPVIFANDTFPWTKTLEANWGDIQTEIASLLPFHAGLPNLQDIQQEQAYITTDDKWKTFFLLGFGHECRLNMEKCPKTTALIKQIPDIQTALFSILSPGKHIPRHRGVYKGLIRSHLALIVPGKPGDCRMQVGDEWVHWEEGKMVVFDNTRFHEVWNDTDQIRVVLLIDVIRPFRGWFDRINRGIIHLIARSPYVAAAFKKHRQWEREFDRRYQESHAS
jgi:ornithine lipid ester-linked acyl 2-hydroxylase